MMKRIVSTLFLLFLWSIAIFWSGYFYAKKTVLPQIKEVEVVKTVDKIVYRDYSKIDCCEIARFYDTTPIKIVYNVNQMNSKHTNIDVVWRLHDRQGVENVNIPVYSDGNWKFYLGVGFGAFVTGAVVYKVIK
jgi:hypothetical protein